LKKLYALRGAVQCENNASDICLQIGILYDELLSKNNLTESDIVSCIFSITSDLDAVNPASAFRRHKSLEVSDLSFALFSVQEPDTQDALERTVRILIHCYLDEGSALYHVYRNGAEKLIKNN